MSHSATDIPSVTVSAAGEKSLRRRHPWIFSGAVQRQQGDIAVGGTVAVRDEQGQWLAWGAYSPHSQIRVRIWSFDENERIDEDFFARRIRAAVRARAKMPLLSPCTALRLVYGESDGLPGLIVDRYNDIAVCQFLTAGTALWQETIVAQLRQQLDVVGIFERSDADVRVREGLPMHSGLLWGAAPPELLEVQMGMLRFQVDVAQGHKTGTYLDQRENQARVRDFAAGAEMLDCFSYTGGFGLAALAAGAAKVTHLDASADMLALARRNAALNGLSDRRIDYVAANVFEQLRSYRDQRRQFDLIVLDPPKFVSSAGQMHKGTRGYKDINLLALKLLRGGGMLLTFSCSGLVSAPLFQKITADAALDAKRTVRLIGHLHQAADHPVALNFPEGAYLKGLICMAE